MEGKEIQRKQTLTLFTLVKPLELYLLLQMRTISVILHAVVALSMAGNAALAAPYGNKTKLSEYVLYLNQLVSCSSIVTIISSDLEAVDPGCGAGFWPHSCWGYYVNHRIGMRCWIDEGTYCKTSSDCKTPAKCYSYSWF